MAKYFISNNIQFVQGIGNLVDSPTAATHVKQNDARRYISMHPDHVMIMMGKKRKYIISTSQKYIGTDGSVVNSMKSARAFNSPDEAFDYMENNPAECNNLGKAIVINEDYKKFKRKQIINQRPIQKKLVETNTDRITFSKQTRQMVMSKYNCTCPICGKTIRDDELSIDHIVPLSRGGSNDLTNLRPTHQICNRMKNNNTDEEFYNSVSDIACNYLYNMPGSDMSMRIIRSIVRGTIRQNGGVYW